MIDEKKLIERFKQLKGSDSFANMFITDVIKEIQNQPQKECSECSRRKFYQLGYQDGVNADKWIPCEERLPDDFMSMKYLTTIKGHFYSEINYYCVVNHKWFSSEKTTKEVNVIAWQPLPQSYKKEGAE